MACNERERERGVIVVENLYPPLGRVGTETSGSSDMITAAVYVGLWYILCFYFLCVRM